MREIDNASWIAVREPYWHRACKCALRRNKPILHHCDAPSSSSPVQIATSQMSVVSSIPYSAHHSIHCLPQIFRLRRPPQHQHGGVRFTDPVLPAQPSRGRPPEHLKSRPAEASDPEQVDETTRRLL